MQTTAAISRLTRLACLAVAGILVLLPFHALCTTWAGSNFGHIDSFRVWKELLMVPLGLYAAWIVITDRKLAKQFGSSWLAWFIVVYTLLFLLFSVVALRDGRVTTEAVLFSLVTNLRFVWFFLIAWVISSKDDLVRRQWAKILLIPAAIVTSFGLLQRFVLPADFLIHFGYGPNTIPAIQTVDNKIEYQRIQSTLRGANPLGAYLVLIVTAVVTKMRSQKYMPVLLGATMLVLFFSYSRSAWIGLVVALGVLGWQQLNRSKNRQILIVSLVLALLVGLGSIWLFRDNDTLQNTIFHSDETSSSVQSSNAARTAYLQQGISEVKAEPFGRGPGTAGPASARNNNQARIAENYYIQIGQEVGAAGVILFVGIVVLVAKSLWRRRNHSLAQVLIASLAGICVINLLSHAWTDDSLSLLWWGLAGAAMTLPAIMNPEHKQHEETSTQKN